MTTLDEIFPEPKAKELLEEAYGEFVESGGYVQPDTFEALKRAEGHATAAIALTEYGGWYQKTEAQLRAKKAELEPLIEKMQDEIRFHEQRLEFIKWRIQAILTPSEESQFTNDTVDMFYKRSISTEIEDPERIPVELCTVKTYPNKEAIKAKLEAGEDVNGARLSENFSLQIKPGGDRAIANAKARARRRERAANNSAKSSDQVI